MVSQAKQQPRYTPEEYLTLEREASFRSEYLAGEITAMAGASLQHNRITSNIGALLNVQLTERPCDSFTSDMRVKVEAPQIYYTYPDAVALCGEPQFDDAHQDCLINPMLIVEVLSPSTQRYDQQEKFGYYRKIASLMDYVLVAQDRVCVEHYSRQGAFQWLLTEYNSLEDTITLSSIACKFLLADIYKKVEFPLESPEG